MKRAVTRRSILKASAGVLGVGVLAACTPATPQVVKETVIVEGTPQVVEKEVTAAPTAASAGVEGKKGVLWGLQYDPHVAAYKRLADLFQQKTGGTLDVQPQGWPIETKLVAALAADNQPDVVCIMPTQTIGLFIQKALIDVGETVYNPLGIDPYKTFAAAAIDSWMWEGHYYGVAVEVSGVGCMVNVPTKDVESAGLADKYPPTNGKDTFASYEEMWELAEALMIKQGDEVTRWGLSSQGWDAFSYIGLLLDLYSESGKKVFDPDTETFNINTDEGVKALELLVEDPVKMGIERQLDKNGIDAALAGQVALVRGNGTPATKEGFDLGYHFELVGAPPAVAGRAPIYFDNGSWGFTAPARTKNPDISVEFLKMMCTTEGQREYCRIYGGMGQVAYIPLQGVYDHFENPDPNSPIVQSMMRYQKTMIPACLTFNPMAGVCCLQGMDAFADVRQQKISCKEAVQVMQAEVEAKYKQFQEDIKSQQYS